MKRETRKQKDIGAFKIDIDELDGLISSLKHEFDRPEDKRQISIGEQKCRTYLPHHQTIQKH